MRIIEQPRPVNLGGNIVQSAHQLMVTLAPNEKVRAGTPIRPGHLGWEVDPTGLDCWAFAAGAANGGDKIGAWRSMTLEFNRDLFPTLGQAGSPGPWRCGLIDVDDQGNLSLRLDPEGPFAVLAPHRVLLVPTH